MYFTTRIAVLLFLYLSGSIACPLLLNYKLTRRLPSRGRAIADAGDPLDARPPAGWAGPGVGPVDGADAEVRRELPKKLRGFRRDLSGDWT